jgi:hypothetical protein
MSVIEDRLTMKQAENWPKVIQHLKDIEAIDKHEMFE